jgi:hypothetical protein
MKDTPVGSDSPLGRGHSYIRYYNKNFDGGWQVSALIERRSMSMLFSSTIGAAITT